MTPSLIQVNLHPVSQVFLVWNARPYCYSSSWSTRQRAFWTLPTHLSYLWSASFSGMSQQVPFGSEAWPWYSMLGVHWTPVATTLGTSLCSFLKGDEESCRAEQLDTQRMKTKRTAIKKIVNVLWKPVCPEGLRVCDCLKYNHMNVSLVLICCK